MLCHRDDRASRSSSGTLGRLTVRSPLVTSTRMKHSGKRFRSPLVAAGVLSCSCGFALPIFAQTDPASEPTVLAVAKALPAVVNINTERVVRRRVRDPFEDFAAQYFGNYRSRPREIRQTLQSLGSGFIVDPAGYIVTNQHVVERAADLKIEVTFSDGKTVPGRFITGDEKKDLAFIKIDAKEPLPFIDLNNLSPNLLGQTVIVVGQRPRLQQHDQPWGPQRNEARHHDRRHRVQESFANRRGD